MNGKTNGPLGSKFSCISVISLWFSRRKNVLEEYNYEYEYILMSSYLLLHPPPTVTTSFLFAIDANNWQNYWPLETLDFLYELLLDVFHVAKISWKMSALFCCRLTWLQLRSGRSAVSVSVPVPWAEVRGLHFRGGSRWQVSIFT